MANHLHHQATSYIPPAPIQRPMLSVDCVSREYVTDSVLLEKHVFNERRDHERQDRRTQQINPFHTPDHSIVHHADLPT